MKSLAASGSLRSRPAPILFCDFDGTITLADVMDEILARLADPSWQEIEQEWVRGAIGSRECMERQMALVKASPRQLEAIIDAVPVDPGFSDFYRFTRQRRWPLYVLSDGFDYVISRVLKRCGVNGALRNGTHLFAGALRAQGRRVTVSFPQDDCSHGCATCKAAIMRRLGVGRSPIIFVGDGLSDRFAVKEADVVFAKRQLLAFCREQGIACQPFETFADVRVALEAMLEPGALRTPGLKGPRRPA